MTKLLTYVFFLFGETIISRKNFKNISLNVLKYVHVKRVEYM